VSADHTVVTSKPTLAITDPQPVCAPLTVDLTDPAITTGSENGLSFYYYSDPSGTTTISNPNAIGNGNTYYIQGKNTVTGCFSDLYPVVVKINNKPSITVNSDGTDICKGSSVTLTASSPGNSIEWLNVGAGNTVMVTPLVSTTYTGIATSPVGCADTASITIEVKKFTVTLTASTDPVLAGNTFVLNSSANFNYDIISWMPENLFTDQSAISQSLIISDTSKTFSIIARSNQGCLDTAYTKVTVNPNTRDFFIPNAFTPNNDGKNDVFKVYGSSIKEINMRVFNQWGQLLFETKDQQRGWDGYYGGHPQPTGVYVYVAKIIFYDNTVHTGKGTINLIR
jgi:gliding motility-associated-like protein